MRLIPSDTQDFAYTVTFFRVTRGGRIRVKLTDGSIVSRDVRDGAYVNLPVRRLFRTGTTASGFNNAFLDVGPDHELEIPYSPTTLPPVVPPPPSVPWTPAAVDASLAPDVTAMRAAGRLYSSNSGTGSAVTAAGVAVRSFRCTLTDVLFDLTFGSPATLADLGGGAWGLVMGEQMGYTSGTISATAQSAFGVAGLSTLSASDASYVSAAGSTTSHLTIVGSGDGGLYFTFDENGYVSVDAAGNGLTSPAPFSAFVQAVNGTGNDPKTYLNKLDVRSGDVRLTDADSSPYSTIDSGNPAAPTTFYVIGASLGTPPWTFTAAILFPAPVSNTTQGRASAWLAARNPAPPANASLWSDGTYPLWDDETYALWS